MVDPRVMGPYAIFILLIAAVRSTLRVKIFFVTLFIQEVWEAMGFLPVGVCTRRKV